MLTGRHVNKYYKKYFLFFFFGILALIVVDFAQLLIPEYYGAIIDGLANGSMIENYELVYPYLFYIGLIVIVMFSGRFMWRYCIFGVSVRIETDIRLEMFEHCEKLSQSFYKKNKVGELMALFTNDLQTIKQCFGGGTIQIIDAVFLGSFALYKMFRLNYILAIIALVPMALIAVISILLGRLMEKKYAASQEAFALMSDFTQENLSGIAVIKAFVREYKEVKEFAKVNKNNYDKTISFVRLSTLLDVLLTLVICLIMACLVGGGAYFVINDDNFTIGNLTEYIAYFDTLTWPMMAIGMFINMRSQAKASLKRIDALLDEKIEIVDNGNLVETKIEGAISFNDLSFKFDDSNLDVLSHVSFDILPGEMVGIVGKTGCGKTTVVDLMMRIHNVDKNKIFIDGVDIMDISFKEVREKIGYVPQDNFLFSDTIKNNISFAFSNSNDDLIIDAAKLADIDSNIRDFEYKYDTVIGERGVTLSGGQKQRISIARALIKNPEILIFDDSVSAVDTKTEKTILDNLRSIRAGKTTIMIAHRISTVEHLDKIILLDEGKVVAVGNHQKLVKSVPLYQEMVRLQSLEKEVEGGDQ